MATITNSNAESFGVVNAGNDVVISQARYIFPGANGGAAINTPWFDLSNSRTYSEGDEIVLPVGDAVLTLPPGEFGDDLARAFVDDFLHRRGVPVMELGHNSLEVVNNRGYSEQTVEVTAAT